VVGRRGQPGDVAPKTVKRLKKQFESRLAERGLSSLIERDVTLELPTLGRRETFPFSFRNGQINVIKPIVFGSDREKNVNIACVLAMEGHDLIKREVKLNVLAEFHEDGIEYVRRTLEEMSVVLRTADHLEEFVREIERTAH
jgi:hypothetical protein